MKCYLGMTTQALLHINHCKIQCTFGGHSIEQTIVQFNFFKSLHLHKNNPQQTFQAVHIIGIQKKAYVNILLEKII